MSQQRPRIRYLEAYPHQEGNQTLIILRDPLQIGSQTLVVTPELYSVLHLFDGENDFLEIQAALTRQTGQLVFRENLEAIVDRLDEAFFLDNDNFRRRRTAILRQFKRKKIRRPAHAGQSYPLEPADLEKTLESFYTHEQGAGLPEKSIGQPVRALLAPHIDLRLGGPIYSHAYRALGESERPDLVVILGTGHMGLPRLFSISRKDFQTPFGLLKNDRDFLEIFDSVVDKGLFEEDLSHKTEHTIEFQTIFLHHRFLSNPPQILPVLSSFSFLELTSDPHRRELFEQFVCGLREAEARSGKRLCFVGSVDLAHIGPRYGDQNGWPSVEKTTQLDQEMLRLISASDPEGFFNYIASERDSRRICGFPSIYTILRLVDGIPGRLLSHSSAKMDSSGSYVTFASMVFNASK